MHEATLQPTFESGAAHVPCRWRRVRLSLVFGALALITAACSLSFSGEGDPLNRQSVAVISGAPVVQIAAPLPNATYLAGVSVNLLAAITNAGSDIQRVEIKLGDATLADLRSPNPSGAARFSVAQTWIAETAGEYTFTVTAFRADGTSSAAASVRINVVAELPQAAATVTLTPTTQTPPTVQANTPTPTLMVTALVNATTPPPTNVTATLPSTAPTAANPGEVRVRVIAPAGMFVRQGPGTNFPRLGALAGDTELQVFAANPDGSWFKIQFQGGEAWIGNFSNLISVIAGDPATLPREVGPTPIPITNTPAAGMTNTPPPGAGSVNLRITGFELIPAPPGIFVNEPAKARINIFNESNQSTPSGFNVTLAIANANDAGALVSRTVAVRALTPNENFLVEIDFVDNTQAGVLRRAVAIVDPENVIAETNNDDNASNNIEYVLGAR